MRLRPAPVRLVSVLGTLTNTHTYEVTNEGRA